ncbi:MAG: hypothetical protein ACXIVD_16000 [Salinarimonas sp.]
MAKATVPTSAVAIRERRMISDVFIEKPLPLVFGMALCHALRKSLRVGITGVNSRNKGIAAQLFITPHVAAQQSDALARVILAGDKPRCKNALHSPDKDITRLAKAFGEETFRWKP